MKRSDRQPLVALCLALALATGCGDDGTDEPACADISLDCAPLFAPEFDAVYDNVIEPTCAVSGGACHASEGARGGLAFPADDADAAYQALLGGGYVVPGDGLCSELSQRVASDDSTFVMPRGAPLAESAQCAIVQWIEGGAAR